MVAGRRVGGNNREFGMDMYILLYLKEITNRNLFYTTGSSALLCGSLDGRGVCGRMDTGLCMAESLCCVPETIPTLLIGYTPI